MDLPKKADPTERPEALATCLAKHTKYNPNGAEWACPKCRATADVTEGFFVEDSPNHDCAALHEEDSLTCYACGYGISGKSFAARLQKAANMVPCPTCKGHGLVKGGP